MQDLNSVLDNDVSVGGGSGMQQQRDSSSSSVVTGLLHEVQIQLSHPAPNNNNNNKRRLNSFSANGGRAVASKLY
jgi:hypothetical protein